MYSDAEIRETLDGLAAELDDEPRRVIWVVGRLVCPEQAVTDFRKATDHLVGRAQSVSARIARVRRKIERYLTAQSPAN